MRHNYKIKVDEPLPDEQSIARHKDFSRLLSDYHNLTEPLYRRPLYKNPRTFIGLVFILVLVFLVFRAVEEEEEMQKDVAETGQVQDLPPEIRHAAEKAFYQPLSQALAVPAAEHKVLAADAQKITLKGGTEIDIPAGAFFTAAGEPVRSGEITLKVREFDDPVTIAANGIPMYGQAAEKTELETESTGMIEIVAFQNGERLQLGENMVMTVTMPVRSAQPAQEVSVFTLAPQSRKWESRQANFELRTIKDPNAAYVGQNTGFGAMEIDEDGNIRHKKVQERDKDGVKTVTLQTFEVGSLGTHALMRGLPGQNLRPVRVQPVDEKGVVLELYGLYRLTEGLNAVAVAWPEDGDFHHTLKLRKGIPQQVFGLTKDGQLAIADAATLQAVLANESNAQQLTMKLVPETVKNIASLKQLLAF